MGAVSEWELLLRLTLSCILGGVIGYERQSRHKSAGLRTNILVCLGSCLIMVLSESIFLGVEGRTNADPARLAAQVVVQPAGARLLHADAYHESLAVKSRIQCSHCNPTSSAGSIA